jgi:subtilisin
VNKELPTMRHFTSTRLAAVLAMFLAALILVCAASHVAAAGGEPPAGGGAAVDVLIGFHRTPGAAEQQLVRQHGGVVRRSFTLVPAIAATLPEQAIAALQRNPRIAVIEPDGRFQAIGQPAVAAQQQFATELADSWGVARIGAGIVHSGDSSIPLPANRGIAVGLAIVDSGIDYNHPEFLHNYAGGHNFHGNNADPRDDNGHGTHVAGSAAAARDGLGVVGVAPDVQLFALKVLGADGGGSFSNVIAALQWCVQHNDSLAPGQTPILIANHSYGSSGDPGTLVRQAFNNSYAAGILHVAAAGNSGNAGGNNNSIIYPARYASVIAVAATDASDRRANWSSTGPDLELSAPGVSIKSAWPGGGYRVASGTSMAAPHVAGVAALVLSSYSQAAGDDAAPLSNLEVRQILAATADNIGNANRYGAGLVNAVEAVLLATPADDDPPADGDDQIMSVTAIDYGLHNNGRHLDISLTVEGHEGGLGGALVAIQVLHNGALLASASGTTGADGRLGFRLNNAPGGVYTTVVISVTRDGWQWDGLTPDNYYLKP